jgi:hypothetical protein
MEVVKTRLSLQAAEGLTMAYKNVFRGMINVSIPVATMWRRGLRVLRVGSVLVL